MLEFKELKALVEMVTKKDSPSLYRKLYGAEEQGTSCVISSMDEWESLPFLEKDVLLDTPLNERTFTSPSNIDHFRTSSGTSGKPPLFCPRTYLRNMSYRTEYHDFKKPILAFTVPAISHWHEIFQASLGHTTGSVVFDPSNVRASVKIAHEVGVDSISVFTFHMPFIAEEMKKLEMCGQIKFIEMAGEACSLSMYKYLRETFPNAVLLPFYGSSEVEDSPIGMPCRAITGEEPLAQYHAKKSQYHEILDPISNTIVAPETGAEGELVITAYPGEPSAFPLIRFKTGDMIKVTGGCERHKTWSFTVVGRVASDFAKIQGGMIRVDEVERVLRSMSEDVSDRFKLVRTETSYESGPRIGIELHIERLHESPSLSELTDRIASSMRVGPARTYAQGVADGMYSPMICVDLEDPLKASKSKKLINF